MPSKIEWTEETWNPVTGCSKISPGCDHCYAERMSKRLAGRVGYPAAPNSFDVTLHSERLGQPLRWRKPRRIFVCSMGDLFHDDVPFEYIAAVFGAMAATPQHTYQILTKRPRRARAWFEWVESEWNEARQAPSYAPGSTQSDIVMAHAIEHDVAGVPIALTTPPWPLEKVWFGVTAEDQNRADERIPILLQIPAAVRFVSVEPMLSAIDLWAISDGSWYDAEGATRYNALSGTAWWGGTGDHGLGGGPALDLVIVGGETGPGSRPMHPDWARSLRDQCVDAGVPFFFKQWGGTRKKRAGRELDGRTWNDMPEVK